MVAIARERAGAISKSAASPGPKGLKALAFATVIDRAQRDRDPALLRDHLQEGGQAIFNLRGWAQSERFDQAWALLAATFHAEITLLNDVVSITPRRA